MGSLTTTQPPSIPVCQPSEHTLNLIYPSVENKLATSVILWFFTIPLLFHFWFCFVFILI